MADFGGRPKPPPISGRPPVGPPGRGGSFSPPPQGQLSPRGGGPQQNGGVSRPPRTQPPNPPAGKSPLGPPPSDMPPLPNEIRTPPFKGNHVSGPPDMALPSLPPVSELPPLPSAPNGAGNIPNNRSPAHVQTTLHSSMGVSPSSITARNPGPNPANSDMRRSLSISQSPSAMNSGTPIVRNLR